MPNCFKFDVCNSSQFFDSFQIMLDIEIFWNFPWLIIHKVFILKNTVGRHVPRDIKKLKVPDNPFNINQKKRVYWTVGPRCSLHIKDLSLPWNIWAFTLLVFSSACFVTTTIFRDSSRTVLFFRCWSYLPWLSNHHCVARSCFFYRGNRWTPLILLGSFNFTSSWIN